MGGYGQLALARESMIPLEGASPLPAMGQALNLAGLLQNQSQQRQLFPGELQRQQIGNQLGQQAVAQGAQEQQDQAEFKRLFHDSNGDPDEIQRGLYSADYNLSAGARMKAAAELANAQNAYGQLSEAKRNRAIQDSDLMQGSLDAVQSAGPVNQAAVYAAHRAKLIQAGVEGSDQLPEQFPGMDWLKTQEATLTFHSANLKKKADFINVAPGGSVFDPNTGKAVFTAQPKQEKQSVEDQELADYLKRNPGKGASDFAAYKAGLSRDPNAASDRQFRQGQQSYQYSSNALDKVGQPIEQLVQRMSRLKDTLAQANPQADALVAPELLTVMAGGMGSGLRMNEAEISRIVGGRNNWESLKSAINKWQTDPSQPFLITPVQRGQINALLDEVNGKLQAKQGILDQARQDIANSNDPQEHRQILAKARNRLMAIDQGQGGGGQLSSAAQAFISKYSK